MVKLTWTHCCEFLTILDDDKRGFYEREAINSGWSVRKMKRQIDSSLFERLLLSRGDVNKERVLELAHKGIEISEPADIIRDPYVFEFLGLPEDKLLRAYVLVELKTTKLTPEAAGQINLYLNYYAAEVNDADDNPPIGIILCTDKDSVTAEYALGGLSNNVFAIILRDSP